MEYLNKFKKVKLICGVIFGREEYLIKLERDLRKKWGEIDYKTKIVPFDLTDYYEEEMGKNLKRIFYSFKSLIKPEEISKIKLRAIKIEKKYKKIFNPMGRVVNIDPGYVTATALIMATTKNYSHRVPLQHGIYAHLEFLFKKNDIKYLEWTYSDLRKTDWKDEFLSIRRLYLKQIKDG
ncbi:MAG: DUF4416 family protein [Acidobacteriota bacterium]